MRFHELEQCANPQSDDFIAEFNRFAGYGWGLGAEAIIQLIERIPLSARERKQIRKSAEMGIKAVYKRPFNPASLGRMAREYQKIIDYLDTPRG